MLINEFIWEQPLLSITGGNVTPLLNNDTVYFKNKDRDFPGGAVVKNPPANAQDTGSIPGPGRFPHAAEQLSPCTTTTEPEL